MSQRRYDINEEIEVNITVKVKIKEISNYFSLDDKQIKECVEDFKNEIGEHLKSKLAVPSYQFEEVTRAVDGWNFEVE